jgi:hypothetical protein
MPANWDAVDVDLESATRHWLEVRMLAHPADHRGWIGQMTEHLPDRCRKVDFSSE